jgi:hypothetical protein
MFNRRIGNFRSFLTVQRISSSVILCTTCIVLSVPVSAQEKAKASAPNLPIPVEFIAGHKRFGLQTQINKHFRHTSKFGFLSITSATASYKNDRKEFDFINTSQVSYLLAKGFGVSTGISMNAESGFNPTAGMQYVFANKLVLIVLAPSILLSRDHNVQTVSVIEYKPSFKDNWGGYSKIQAFYSHNIDKGYHQRSYLVARLGLSYQSIDFGVGANWDWYGSNRLSKQNYGLFLLYAFF